MRRATAYTLASAVLWGSTFPAIQVGLGRGGAGPFTFVALRFVVAAVAMAVLAWSLGRFQSNLFRSRAIWGLALLNAIGYALQFVAQDRTSASKTSLLVDINVVAIAILGFFLLRERHAWTLLASLLLGIAGVVLLSTGGDWRAATFASDAFVGDALAMSAGLVWSFQFVGVKLYLDRHPTTDGVAFTFATLALTALFLLVPASFVEGLGEVGTPTAWGMTAYLGLFATTFAFWLWQEALRTEGVTVTSVLLLLEIVVAVGISVAFLHEGLGPWSWVGAGLIVMATVLAGKDSPAAPNRERRAPGPAEA